MQIPRYSWLYSLILLPLLCFYAVFAFIVSAEHAIKIEDCRALGLPILEITTEKLKPVKTKEHYVKADFSLNGVSGKCKIRGHGNSTWKTTFSQKKPYLLKLESAQSLLDMPAAQKWILMANTCDRSMLRNFYAEYLTHNVWAKMRWNPSSRFITLFLNGKYQGLYGLTEKVEISENRLTFEGEGFLAEIDSHQGRPYKFLSNKGLNFNIREPEAEQSDYERWAARINEMEQLIYSENFHESGEYKKFFDFDSFVDWYLLAEYSKNYDANFYNSVFMNYDYGRQKLFMGPAWDHDIGFGNTAKSSTSVSMSYGSLLSNSAWFQMFKFYDKDANSTSAKDYEGFLINQNAWYYRLFSDIEFVKAVKMRWNETRPALEQSVVWLRQQGVELEAAAEMNDSVWHIIGSSIWPRAPGYRLRKTYASEVEYFADWCENRIVWLDSVFG